MHTIFPWHAAPQYVVSTGTTLPEVFFDFWKTVSGIIDEHRATSESRSFQKLVMFVAPFCEVHNMAYVQQQQQRQCTTARKKLWGS